MIHVTIKYYGQWNVQKQRWDFEMIHYIHLTKYNKIPPTCITRVMYHE